MKPDPQKKAPSRGRPFLDEADRLIIYSIRIRPEDRDWLKADKKNLAQLRAWLKRRSG